MAVRTCKRCGQSPVAYDAVCCPFCGSRDPHTSKFMLYLGASVFMAISLAVLVGVNALLGGLMVLGALGSIYHAWRV